MTFTFTRQEISQYEKTAARVRRHILESIHRAQAGHIGGSFSAVELLIALYFKILRVDPQNSSWEDRDRFVLSKGHAAIGLYAVMAERGFFPLEELATFDILDTRMQSHPEMNMTPGLDMSTGSLGQGFSSAVGIALGARILKKDFMTYVLLGDGEIQEGQVWEAANMVSRYRVDNLIAILDNNQYQLCDCEYPQPKVPCDNPGAKFQAFGWQTIEVDGHDFKDIISGFNRALQKKGQPVIIIANTVKGKGVSFMEETCEWHAKAPNDEEFQKVLVELA